MLQAGPELIAYLYGGYGKTGPNIEAPLEGREVGYQVRLNLKPEDAFGLRDESLAPTIPPSEFPPGVKVGGQLPGRTDDGHEQAYNVVKINGPLVHIDDNYPLAGKALCFALPVDGDQRATAEEATHGHEHGAHGHHH